MGTWDYDYLSPVAAANHSLARMTALLEGPLCCWPEDRLTVLHNELVPGDIALRLITTFAEATDVALFYYVGHGQIDDSDELCLGLVESRIEPNLRAATSLQYQTVRRALLDSEAATKIVILDCCFAALANRPTNTLAAFTGSVLDQASATGAYTMAACPPYATALYESNPDVVRPQTFFTKYLADLIEAGLPGQPPGLRLHSIFTQVKTNLARDHRPIPDVRNVDAARDFIFAHNAAPPQTHTDPVVELEQVHRRLVETENRRAEAERRRAEAEARRNEAEARERALLERFAEQAHRSSQPQAREQEELRDDLREAIREIDAAATDEAAADAELRDADLAARVWAYCSDSGPAKLRDNPPGFADERYRALARAAVAADNPEAIRQLVKLSQQHEHIEGEACWLAAAYRLGLSGIALPLARVLHRAGLAEAARSCMIVALIEGSDESAREVLNYPPDVLQTTLLGFDESYRNFDTVLTEAARNGSSLARYELGASAVAARKYQLAVQHLQSIAAAGNVNAQFLLGKSLIALQRRRRGRFWLRKAAKSGHAEARVELAKTLRRRWKIRAIARDAIADFDARPPRDQVTGLMMQLAERCVERQLTGEAIECLRRVAAQEGREVMARLSDLELRRGNVGEASAWLARAVDGMVLNVATQKLIFDFACRLSWAGDDEGSRRWLERLAEAENAQALEIAAGLGSLPPKPHWHPPSPRSVWSDLRGMAARGMAVVPGDGIRGAVSVLSAIVGALAIAFGVSLFVISVARHALRYHYLASGWDQISGVAILICGAIAFYFATRALDRRSAK